MSQIRVLLGYQQGHVFSLRGQAVAIGRDPKSEIVLHPDSAASRRHAEVFVTNGHWRVRDLGSVNGTAVNGRRVKDEALRDKDELIIGDNVFVFEDGDLEAAQIEEAATRVNLVESRGFPNRPETQVLVRSMDHRTKEIETGIGAMLGGKTDAARLMLCAAVAQGHVFLERTPSGKAAPAARGMAEILGLTYRRMELTGGTAANSLGELAALSTTGAGEFNGAGGFSQVVLLDGLQRAPLDARAQVFEALEPYDALGRREVMHNMWLVSAPEPGGEGSANLPFSEEQLDRFMFSFAWPGDAPEADGPERAPVLTRKKVQELQRAARELVVCDHIVRYAVKLVRATRPADSEAPNFIWMHGQSGAGPRAAQHLVLAAKANAVLDGRLLVGINDVRRVAGAILRHRVFTNFTAAVEGVTADKLVARILAEIPEPSATED